MNWLDIVIIVLLVVSFFGGWRNGLIRSFLSLAGLIAAISLAGRFYVPLAERLTFISAEKVAQIAAFSIILLAVLIIATLAGALLTMIISKTPLGLLNHVAGGVFGILVAALLISALLATWVKFFGISQIVSDSGLAALLLDRWPAVLALLPDEFDAIRSFFR
ncbi:MAG: CvpA family protein [Chloroflexi bacterium]|nr:CvpA family protein [Chloroflexota bacterium]